MEKLNAHRDNSRGVPFAPLYVIRVTDAIPGVNEDKKRMLPTNNVGALKTVLILNQPSTSR